MRSMLKLFALLVLWMASHSAFAVTVDHRTICQNTTVPSGWVVVDKSWNRHVCGKPATPQGNVWTIDEYDNLPVGTPLTICSSSAVPSGWYTTSLVWNPAVCGAQFSTQSGVYNTAKIYYVDCTHESNTLCYPFLTQFAVVSALPTTVSIPYGKGSGSTEIAWYAPSQVCVWVTTESTGLTQLWACAGHTNSQTWPYVEPGVTQTFKVSASSASPEPELASVAVRGVEGTPPRITASPEVVTVPAGQTQGSTKISYNLNGSFYPAMCIWMSTNGAPARLLTCGVGSTFSTTWAHVPRHSTTVFWLNPSATSSSQILATVSVTGQ